MLTQSTSPSGSKIPFDGEKLKSLVHYILWKVADPAKLHSTKIHKILWLSDARAFVLLGQSITGETYIRREHGPIAQHLLRVCEELVEEGRVSVVHQPLDSHHQGTYRALRMPDGANLTDQQREIVDQFIRHVTEEQAATSIGEESDDAGWRIAAVGEELPYCAILADRVRRPSGQAMEWARATAKKLNLP